MYPLTRIHNLDELPKVIADTEPRMTKDYRKEGCQSPVLV